MSGTRKTTLAFILSELFLLDGFCNFVYYHDTIRLCRTGHEDVSGTKIAAFAFILSELLPLDCFRCNFVSAP